MKFLFSTFVFLFGSLTSKSQLNTGTWLAGGNGKFYSYTSTYSSSTYSNEASYTQIDFSPNVGYFVADKLAFGLRPTFSSMKGKVTTTGGLRTNTRRYSVGPFARYYFLNSDKEFNVLADIGYQYGITNLDGKKVGNFNSFSLLAGPAIYFNSSVGLEFLLGYSSSLEDIEQGSKETKKGFQLSIGFQVHLAK